MTHIPSEEDMTNQEIQSLLEAQRAYYRSGATIPVRFRVEQLKKLYAAVKKTGTRSTPPSRRIWGRAPTRASCASPAWC